MTELKQTKLRVGDQVELRIDQFPSMVVRGAVRMDDDGCCLALGPWSLVTNGESALQAGWHLTVTKLAPRPFYANHKREEPNEGDVARDAITADRTTYTRSGARWWIIRNGSFAVAADLPESLILLVDGDTGLPAAPLQEPEPVHSHTH